MKDSNTEIEGLQNYGGGTRIRFKILSEEVRLFFGVGGCVVYEPFLV